MIMELIQEGAEAKIFKKEENDKVSVVKKRIKKKYRIDFFNDFLIPKRTKREIKVLKKLNSIINVPKIIFDNKKDIIEMEFIQGQKLRDVLNDNVFLSEKVGKMLAKMHDLNIVHGDLTTSNMILTEKNKVFFIDFGLSQFSSKLENKAVDIHLFKQALESKHHKIFESAYTKFLKGYKSSLNTSKVLERLKTVESRGRNIKK